MNPIRVTFARTVGRLRHLSSTALAVGGFLAASALIFALGLEGAEGGPLTLAAVWATSVSPVLPVLAAVLAMDVWSDERLSGRIEFLLSAPVRERDLAIGKFLGVWFFCMLAVFASMLVCLLSLYHVEPGAFAKIELTSFVPGLIALAIQSLLWSAVSVVLSTLFRHAAAAACMSVAVLCGLPRGIWAALLAWGPQGRTSYGEMPLDAHVMDMSLGQFSSGTVLSYLILAAVMIFVCAKCVESMRLVGRGATKARAATGFTVSLSLIMSFLLATLAVRLDVVADFSSGLSGESMSNRTRTILTESNGEIVATCFLPRNDSRFRPVSHMLRSLRKEAAAQGGAKIELRYVDPRWDLGDAQRLVRLGVPAESVVFERKRRRLVVPLSDGFGEHVFATAIFKLTTPRQRSTIYWTVGHGEVLFSDYGTFGMSDIARELSRDGFQNLTLDLSDGSSIPDDCALIIVAGSKENFSHVETDKLDAYLKHGGRLLLLLNKKEDGGLISLLSAWGLRLSSESPVGARTFSGSDVIASSFADHVVTAPLAGTQIVLERPATFEPSAVSSGAGVDAVEFTELARAGGRCLAVAIERGGGSSLDLALRPARMVVIGDSLFVMNGQLAARGNANRDFFLNSVAYLSGIGDIMSGGADGGRLSTGMDRAARIRFAKWSAGIVPGVIFLLFIAYTSIRRRRT